jgi:hypothetical protein
MVTGLRLLSAFTLELVHYLDPCVQTSQWEVPTILSITGPNRRYLRNSLAQWMLCEFYLTSVR